MKVCPVCGSGALEGAETCFECLYSFASMSAANTDREPERKRTRSDLSVSVFESGRKRSTVRSKRGSIYVGRELFNDIAIACPTVARRHLHLYQVGAQLMAEQMEPASTTFVNGVPLQGSREVHPQDRLTIDDVELVVGG